MSVFRCLRAGMHAWTALCASALADRAAATVGHQAMMVATDTTDHSSRKLLWHVCESEVELAGTTCVHLLCTANLRA